MVLSLAPLGARERTNYILNPLFRLFAWHVKGNR